MYLPSTTKNPLITQLTVTIVSIISKEKQTSDGIFPDRLEAIKSWIKRAGMHKRLIWCFIKSSLRTTLPLALVATWKISLSMWNHPPKAEHESEGIKYLYFVILSLRCHKIFHTRGTPKMSEPRHTKNKATWLCLISASIAKPLAKSSWTVPLSSSIIWIKESRLLNETEHNRLTTEKAVVQGFTRTILFILNGRYSAKALGDTTIVH